MNIAGVCKILNVQETKFTDRNTGEIKLMYKCTALTDQGEALVLYRPADEMPQKDDIYQMYIAVDNKLKAVVKYIKEQ